MDFNSKKERDLWFKSLAEQEEKINPKPIVKKKLKDTGEKLDLNYKNDYSNIQPKCLKEGKAASPKRSMLIKKRK